MLKFATRFVSRDFSKELRGMSDEEVARAITGATARIREEFERFREKIKAGLLVPTGTLAESVTPTHYLTAQASEGPPLTLEEMEETYKRLRARTEFKLGGATLNLADYDVREWGGWVVLMRRRLFEPFREFDFIVYVPAEGKAYVMKPRPEPPLEVRPYDEGDRYSRAWAFPFGFMPLAKQNSLLVYGIDFGDVSSPTSAELKWPEVICLTDSEFFEVYDEIEVPA